MILSYFLSKYTSIILFNLLNHLLWRVHRRFIVWRTIDILRQSFALNQVIWWQNINSLRRFGINIGLQDKWNIRGVRDPVVIIQPLAVLSHLPFSLWWWLSLRVVRRILFQFEILLLNVVNRWKRRLRWRVRDIRNVRSQVVPWRSVFVPGARFSPLPLLFFLLSWFIGFDWGILHIEPKWELAPKVLLKLDTASEVLQNSLANEKAQASILIVIALRH